MSWLGDPSKSLVPGDRARAEAAKARPRKAGTTRPAPPSEEDLRAEVASAPEAPTGGAGKAGSAKRGEAKGAKASGNGTRRPGRGHGEIFADCPVTPLGIHGDFSFYLDTRGQLRGVDNHSVQKILHVFGGRVGVLAQHYPSLDKDGLPRPARFDGLKAATAMISATEERGVWSPVGRVRGAGAWPDDDGRLIYHAGDEVLIDGKWHPPGVYDGKVYPAGDPIPRPSRTDAIPTAAEEVLELVQSWNWRRPDIDPVLALGAICAQMVGGALEWRPVTWLTGDAATGKSTFQRALRHIHGGSEGLLQASDATEAGIRSVIGYSSLPVAIDELEPDDDPKKGKAAAIIRLARIAASGDQILRGSTDQKGYQGNAYSCFLFSSILVPPLPPQDRSRLILLDLDRIADAAPKVALEPRRLKQLGASIRRRLIDGWESWNRRLEIWRAGLAARGHGNRAADNYATVLALADLALHGVLPADDMVDEWSAKLDRHLREETVDVGSNADDMLVHLMSQPLDPWRRGKRHTVALWLAVAARLDGAPEEIEGLSWDQANKELAPYGMRVKGRGLEAALVLANKPLAGLAGLFDGTPWAAGVWAQAARRIPAAVSVNSHFARVPSRGYEVPFTSIPGLLNTMDDITPSQRPAPPIPSDIADLE